MSSNRHQRMTELFIAAAQLPPDQQEAFIRANCGGDLNLVNELLELLAPKKPTNTFMAAPAADLQHLLNAGIGPPTPSPTSPDRHAKPTAAPPDQLPPNTPGSPSDGGEHRGDRIGPYKLLEIIGEGGFGTVWLAERREPMVQRVAIKVIKAGMDTKAVVARFEQERQALAVMDHPNVAKVFDAGATPTGRPYFVMEHVQGEPITHYADRHNLTVRQRLELFIPVCEAAQHAHHKGIIHRDLKPSNILVSVRDGAAIPKIIDFGVAKAITHTLTDRTIFTESGQLIGTPEYMSPEQAEMGAMDIDTRTDVYSLGVVLYELLSGMLPFDAKSLRAAGYDAIRKILREQDAPKPSTRLSTANDAEGRGIAKCRVMEREQLARELRRELDWIPLKALRKDRTARYDSPADLAKDIRRYLDGQTLEAGPESPAYRLKKLVRRHRGAALAGSAVLLTLVLGFGTTLWQARRATDREQVAIVATKLAEEKTAEAVRLREAAEIEAYTANLIAAGASLAANEPGQVRSRLDACLGRLRGWEWKLVNAQSDFSLRVLKGHDGGVCTAVYSPAGDRVLTASNDKTSRIWNAATGEELVVLRGHTDGVESAAFSPLGDRVITASKDKTSRVWETMTGKELFVLHGHQDKISVACFNPAGDRIVTVSLDGIARVWEASTGRELFMLRGVPAERQSVSFSPTGDRVVITSRYYCANVWDVYSGRLLNRLCEGRGGVESAAFSPKGDRVVTALIDRTARVWDAATGQELLVLRGHESGLSFASFSPTGNRIITVSWDMTGCVWDANSGKRLTTLRGHEDFPVFAAFSPSGDQIVTVSWDKAARLWNASTGKEEAILRGHTSGVFSASYCPSGNQVVTASGDGTARVWDGATNTNTTVLRGSGDRLESAVFSFQGDRIVTASDDDTARVWDVLSGKELAVLRGHDNWVMSASFSPSADRIITTSNDDTVRVWDAISGQELSVLCKGSVTQASFSPAGDRIVTNGPQAIRVWDANTGKQLIELPAQYKGRPATFSPTGDRIVTGLADGTTRVWDCTNGTQLCVMRGHSDRVTSAEFSVSGDRVVTASWDKTARVWDASTGKELSVMRGHDHVVSSAAFNPSGDRVVTASWDKTVRLWDPFTGKEQAIIRKHTGRVMSASFSPSGDRVVTASYDGTARVWDSVPYRERTLALQTARAAEARVAPLVRERFAAELSPDQVRRDLLNDPSFSAEERTAILASVVSVTSDLAAERLSKGLNLNGVAWNVVRSSSATPDAVKQALVDARKAVELSSPNDGLVLNTLGVALYRAGEFNEALEALTRSTWLNANNDRGEETADFAFLAMCHWKLGHLDEARTALAKLRDIVAKDTLKADGDTLQWLSEAEALITPLPK